MSSTLTAPPPPLPEAPAPAPKRPASAGRVGALIGGGLAAFVAVVLIAAGGFGLWAQGEKDADGYLTTATHNFSTKTFALTTDNLDVNLGAPDWVSTPDSFGKVRLHAESREGKRVFVGIARTSDVQRYLGRTAHATVTDIDTSPFHSTISTTAGGRPAGQPWEQTFWSASSYGMGRRELTWKVHEGDWSVVVMNADGSRGVNADVSAGAELSFLPALGWSLLGGGIVFLLTAGGLVYLGTRSRREA
jgi:hypothetical protein